jgi:hypothetical protein
MFKKLIALGIAGSLALGGAIGCGGTMTNEDQIREVNAKFAAGIQRGNNVAACKVADNPKECVSGMALATMFLGGPEGLKDAMKDAKIKTIKIAADEKSAEVVYTSDDSPNEPTRFVQRDGKWRMVVQAT